MITENATVSLPTKSKVKGFSVGFNALDAEMSQMVHCNSIRTCKSPEDGTTSRTIMHIIKSCTSPLMANISCCVTGKLFKKHNCIRRSA